MTKRLALTLALTLLPAAALAVPAQYYAPAPGLQEGGPELYVPVAFDAPTRLTGSALADAGLAELKKALPDAQAVTVAYKGTAAEVTVDAAKSADAAVADRALGAVFYTLRGAGFTEVRSGGAPLSAGSFSRGAYLAVVPLPAALPVGSLSAGFVRVGDAVMPAAEFYDKLTKGDPAVQAAARALLASGGREVKLGLLGWLTTLRLKDQEAAIIERTKDADPAVRLKAVELLKGNTSKPATKALEDVVANDTAGDVKLAAVRQLVAAGRKEFGKYLLLDKLTSTDAAVVVDALNGLVKANDPAFAPGIAGLASHGNPTVREAAVMGLRTMKQYALLAGLLKDEKLSQDVRASAAKVLAAEGAGAERAAGVSWLVVNGNAEDAKAAADQAGSERLAGTTDALGKALGRSEAEVRLAASKALGVIKDTAGLQPLANAVRATKDTAERAAFSEQAAAIIAAQPLDQVIKIAQSSDVTVRELAIKALAAFNQDKPNKKALDVLMAALSEKEATIREAAAYALARVPDEATVKALVALKGDADAEVRAQVAYAVARSKHPEADAILLAALDDRDESVKIAAIEGARVRNMASALDKVKLLTAHRKMEVKREAMRTTLALAKPGDPTLFDVYAKAMLEQDNELRLLAVDGLGGYPGDPRAAQAIGTAVTDEAASKELKLHALEVLSKLKPDDAVEHVVRGLFDRDRDVKIATLAALEKLHSDKATRPLQEFILGESDKAVADRAQQVLDTL
ncbi:MAG: HEAT repeat domain-containing protein [Myxococcales bacterium]|nr:HEAT repeat domain-containing protein [Myxococcales bacterium]MCB9735676.1 HEAT repeat domain-containing protein [Deltaproteobacteria bacterium]